MNCPLYPQEAYSEQNNARAYANDPPQDVGRQSPLAMLLSGLLSQSGQNVSPLLPVLLKALSKNGGQDDDNPLASLLTTLSSNKKRSQDEQGSEKNFPD